MKSVELGMIVKSKAGRDKDNFSIIIDIQDEYVYLVDGDIRRLEHPKKKKIKHIQVTKTVAYDLIDNLENGKKVTNADIRKALQNYVKDQKISL